MVKSLYLLLAGASVAHGLSWATFKSEAEKDLSSLKNYFAPKLDDVEAVLEQLHGCGECFSDLTERCGAPCKVETGATTSAVAASLEALLKVPCETLAEEACATACAICVTLDVAFSDSCHECLSSVESELDSLKDTAEEWYDDESRYKRD